MQIISIYIIDTRINNIRIITTPYFINFLYGVYLKVYIKIDPIIITSNELGTTPLYLKNDLSIQSIIL